MSSIGFLVARLRLNSFSRIRGYQLVASSGAAVLMISLSLAFPTSSGEPNTV